MIAILQNLGLSDVVNKFTAEKVTPDIVPKLSLVEFSQLGVTSRQKIMDLRVKCRVFSSTLPETINGCNGGASKFVIPRRVLSSLIEEGFSIKDASLLLGVSERTVYRRMHEFCLEVRNFDAISEEELDKCLSTLTKEYPNCGENMLLEILKNDGVNIQRFRVRESLQRVDFDGVKRKEKRKT